VPIFKSVVGWRPKKVPKVPFFGLDGTQPQRRHSRNHQQIFNRKSISRKRTHQSEVLLKQKVFGAELMLS